MSRSDLTRVYAFERNVVLAASAGTGKTHCLVGVMVHLALGASRLEGGGLRPPVDLSRVVATTFSRKAAAEIRARLAMEVARLADGDAQAAYAGDVRAACEREGVRWSDAELADRARRALAGVPFAQVGTLHNLATTIVRAHALLVGLSPRFDFVAEDELRARSEAAIVRVMDARIASEDPFIGSLARLAGGPSLLVAQIARALDHISEDARGAARLAIAGDDARVIDETMSAFIEYARALAGEPLLGEPARAVVQALEGSADTVSARLMDAAAALAGVPARGARSDAAAAFFAFRTSLPGATNADRGRNLVRRWRDRHLALPRATALRDLLAECESEIRDSNRRDSMLGFSDVLCFARDLLRDHPRVAGEVGAGIDALLVDEFQDTSRLQRELVQLLWEGEPRGRAPGTLPSFSRLRPRGLLLVGDRKQSIYGFRGADVSVFAELCVGLAGAPAREALGIAAGAVWEPETPLADFVPLRENRRGRAELLVFANAYSEKRLRPAELPAALYEIDYVPATEDLVPPREETPGASGKSSSSAPPAGAATTWLRVPLREGRSASTRLDEAHVIARRIRAIVERGEPRVRDAHPSEDHAAWRTSRPQWKDIAVLAQRHEMLDAMAYALAAEGVPYVIAGRGFYSAREVRDLAAMLALIVDPIHKLALAEVLRGPWAGVHDATLLGLTDPHAGLAELGPKWDEGVRRALVRVEDRDSLVTLRRVVESLRRLEGRLGPAGVLREAVRELALEHTLILLPRGAQRVANVRKVIALAERETSTRAFLRRLDDAARDDAREAEAATFSEEDDAVRLLTVHASKGLAFPIVFLPEVGASVQAAERGGMAIALGAGEAPSTLSLRLLDADGFVHDTPSFANARQDAARREWAERQRLAYVAATRASEAMLFVGDRRPPKDGPTAAFARTTAGVLAELSRDDATARAAELAVERADVSAPAAPPAHPAIGAIATAAGSEAIGRAFANDPTLPTPAWKSLPIATTALSDFHHCPRRYQLGHVLDLPEHRTAPLLSADEASVTTAREGARLASGTLPSLDARAEGTLAHRVLERIDAKAFGRRDAGKEVRRLLAREGLPAEHPKLARVVERVTRFLAGAYATRVSREGAEIVREQPFVLDLDEDGEGPERRRVVLRGTIDLLVEWKDGTLDVLDYKRAHGGSPEPYAFQLDAYALAAGELYPGPRAIRTGILFLGGDAGEPSWRTPTSDGASRVRARLSALGARLVEARWSETFPRVAVPRCRAIRCGYIGLCHPEAERSATTP